MLSNIATALTILGAAGVVSCAAWSAIGIIRFLHRTPESLPEPMSDMDWSPHEHPILRPFDRTDRGPEN